MLHFMNQIVWILLYKIFKDLYFTVIFFVMNSRDIEEIQTKNQQLLVAIRDLSQQHEEMEKKLSSEM